MKAMQSLHFHTKRSIWSDKWLFSDWKNPNAPNLTIIIEKRKEVFNDNYSYENDIHRNKVKLIFKALYHTGDSSSGITIKLQGILIENCIVILDDFPFNKVVPFSNIFGSIKGESVQKNAFLR